MPVVQIEMWEGRNDEQKESIIKGITKVFEGIGVKSEWLTIIIHDIPKNNWGIQGKQASKVNM
jgi:4-oxalocrotonate tautomerase